MTQYFYDGFERIYRILITLRIIGRYFCMQYAEFFHENGFFLISPFYHGTSMFMGSVEIVIRQML